LLPEWGGRAIPTQSATADPSPQPTQKQAATATPTIFVSPTPTATDTPVVIIPKEQLLAQAMLNSDAKAYCSWRILAQETFEVYAWVLCEQQVAPYSQASVPAAISLDGSGNYLQVTLPRSGTNYADDVTRLFPENIRTTILNNAIDISKLQWGIDQRKAGTMASAYIIPAPIDTSTCNENNWVKKNLPVAGGADKAGWKTYTQDVFGFALDVPATWTVTENWIVCGSGEQLPHSIGLDSADSSYRLLISFRMPDQAVVITRSATPAGDFMAAGNATFLGVRLPVQHLVYQGQGTPRNMAVLYAQSAEFLARGILFTASLDIINDPQANKSIPTDIEAQAVRILASARPVSIPSLAPTSTPLTIPAENATLTVLAQRGGGAPLINNDLALLENTAYIGLGPRLAAIDVSQPAAPQLLAQSPVLPGNVTNVIVISTKPHPQLMVSAGRYIIILDHPEPGKINPAAQVALPGEITSLVLDPSSGTLYVGGSIQQSYDVNNGNTSSGFLATIDVSDTTHPHLVDQVGIPNRVWCLALVPKMMLYAGTFSNQGPPTVVGVIFDPGAQAKLKSPVEVIQDSQDAAHVMQVWGDRLYISWGSAMSAYDISTVSMPKELWKVTQVDVGSSFIFSAFGFVLHENRIDIVGYNSEGGFVAPPLSFTPPQPVIGTSGAVTASMAAGTNDTLFIARDGLEIYDTRDPQNLKELGAYHPPLLFVAGQVVQGDYIYSVDESSLNQESPFLHVLRASDLETVGEYQITLTEQYALMQWYWCMVLDGNRLYVSGRTGVYIFDISKPEKPKLLAYHPELSAWLNAVAAATVNSRRLVFTGEPSTDGGFILKVYDVSDANNVTEADPSITIDGEMPTRLEWNGNSLYLLTDGGSQGGWFYLITLDKTGLVIQCRTALAGSTAVMAVQGNLVALFGSHGLVILSTANPNQPQVLSQSSLKEGLSLVQMVLQGNQLLAVANGGSYQLITFDLSDPTHPTAVNVMAIPAADALGSLSIPGKMFIISGAYSGIEVLK
jgi:hypothetical protein